ncbi:MAG: DUF3090 family protein [Acidimicrobiales bacterium]
MSRSYHFPHLEHFTAGTVGPKGQRAFFIQFGNAGELVSLKVEKAQVHARSEFLDQLLDDVEIPEDHALALDLVEPIEAEWVVSTIGVAYQELDNEFVLVVEELTEDEESESATAQVHLSPSQVQAFVNRSRDLVAAGRPPCAFCGRPLDGDDGWCACHN